MLLSWWALSGVAALAAYLALLRPRLLGWGSTAEERADELPGDDLVPRPTHVTTRAVTVHATPEVIWPWLVQMGQDRAGFYTHNWVERLLLSGIPDVSEIHPEWQTLAPGDLMRTNREIVPGKPLGWRVEVVEPERALVLRSESLPAGTYALSLRPLDVNATRLLVRDRAVWPWWQAPFRLLLFEPLHAYMQIGQLQGLAHRAQEHSTAGGTTSP